MDLLGDNVRAIYRKYFLAAFGSALISCIYGVVDMAMVGQYQGRTVRRRCVVLKPGLSAYTPLSGVMCMKRWKFICARRYSCC